MKAAEKTKQQRIMELEESLDLIFPQSYRQFLLNREEIEKEAGFELPVFGLPKSGELTSAYRATRFLKRERSDLKDQKLVCVRLIKDWAVCLELTNSPEEDCPLVETTLKTETELIPISDSFQKWLEEWKEKEKFSNQSKRLFLLTKGFG